VPTEVAGSAGTDSSTGGASVVDPLQPMAKQTSRQKGSQDRAWLFEETMGRNRLAASLFDFCSTLAHLKFRI
jgi:hypothetical protein